MTQATSSVKPVEHMISDRPMTDRHDAACVFCQIAANEAPAVIVREWPDCLAFMPLNPVTMGHVLVIPRAHVSDALAAPALTGLVMQRASALAAQRATACNLITSVGAAATQTVAHLHVHIVPRRHGDGLPLPWTPQQEGNRD